MISIIMPVYNSGKYLKRSISDIIDQTYRDYELICVDDCSSDYTTSEIVDGLSQIDNRIRVFRLSKHEGAATARNYGFWKAKGDYIVFVDADDRYENIYLESLYEAINNNSADMAVCGHDFLIDDTEQPFVIKGSSIPHELVGITNRVFSLDELGEDGLDYWATNPWNKIVRRSVLIRNNIEFMNMPSGNDMYWSIMCSICSKKIIYCRHGETLVHYRCETNGQISANRDSFSSFVAISRVIDMNCKSNNDKLSKQLFWLIVSSSVNELRNRRGEKKEEYYHFIQEYIKNHIELFCFDDNKMEKYVSWICNNDYKSKWFEYIGDFYGQLQSVKEELLALSKKAEKKILIWGMGERGSAIEQICTENGISVYMTDIKCTLNKSKLGNPVIRPNLNELKNYTIIASNHSIFLRLKEDGIKTDIIDLDPYCPYE